MTDLAGDETPAVVSDEQLAEWEALIEKLNVDEYNQAVPKNAPWRAQPGPCHNWTVYQPIAPSGDYRVIADELREPFATFIAAARSAIPALVRALRDTRDDIERIHAAWCDVIQREQRSDNAHYYDMTQLRAERDSLRDENLRLRSAIEQAFREAGAGRGVEILRAALTAPTGQEQNDD